MGDLLPSCAGTFDDTSLVDDTVPASHNLASQGAANETVATATRSDTSTVTEPAIRLAMQHSVPLPDHHAESAHDLTTGSAAPDQSSAEAALASASATLPSTVAASVQRQSEPSLLQSHSADVTPQQAIRNSQHQRDCSFVHDAAQSLTDTIPIKADTSALHDQKAVESDEASSVSTASSIPEALDEAIEFFISQEPSTSSEEVPQPGAVVGALPSEPALQPEASSRDQALETMLKPAAAVEGLPSGRPQPESSASALPSEERPGAGTLASALPSEHMSHPEPPVSPLSLDSGHLLALTAPASHLTEAVPDQATAHPEQHHAPALLALAEAALADAGAADATEQGTYAFP